jgi:glucuronokinase
MIIRERAFARIGFIGNPSDGFFGKTISSAITNFRAEVTLWESPTLQIIPHRIYDPTEFSSLKDLYEVAIRDGYYGGLRLLFAACKKFKEFCQIHEITLEERNFTIKYDTNIPRQVGLGGSSAIITAAIKALMRFYGVSYAAIPKAILPNLILAVETEELDISAGLQDRVVQVYGGTVYMDFSRELMERSKHGRYEYIDSDLMPPLLLVYSSEPSESGKIHSDIKFRFQSGDSDVVEAMRCFAQFTDDMREALVRRDYDRIGELINANFDLRRRIYGDEVLGERNLEMIQIARELGFPSKFPGSGGAVIVMYRTEEEAERLMEAYREAGYECVKLEIEGSPSYLDRRS